MLAREIVRAKLQIIGFLQDILVRAQVSDKNVQEDLPSVDPLLFVGHLVSPATRSPRLTRVSTRLRIKTSVSLTDRRRLRRWVFCPFIHENEVIFA